MQQYPYPVYRQAPVRPVVTDEMIRQNEKRKLRKRSNGIGFLILTYFATLQVSFLVLAVLSNITGIPYNENGAAEYLIDIAASVFASLIPGLIYLASSGYKLRDSFKKTAVSPLTLITLLLFGMGFAMVANSAAELFINNISIFGLENQAGTVEIKNQTPLELVLSIVATAVVPAFAEEFVFRGIVLGSMKKYGRAFAVVVSSIMFGAMHSNTTQIVFAFLLGLVFAFIDIVADSIVPSLILHFMNNFYAVLMSCLIDLDIIEKTTAYSIYFGVAVLMCVGGIVSFIYLIKTKEDIFRLTDKEKPELPNADRLTLKDKYEAFFVNPGIMISLSTFLIFTVLAFFPQ